MSIADTDVIKITQGQLKYVAQKVKEAAHSGLARVLTTDDYNYPSDNPTSVALWLLDDGIYTKPNNVAAKITTATSFANNQNATFIIGKNDLGKTMLRLSNSAGNVNNLTFYWIENDGSAFFSKNILSEVVDNLTSTSTSYPLSAKQGKVLKDLVDSLIISGTGAPTTSTVGTVGQIYTDTVGGKAYICTAVDSTTTPATYTWEEVGSKVNVAQTTGTSTTDVMSQNATTSMVFADPSTRMKVQIGATASVTSGSNNGVAIGSGQVSATAGGIAIGNVWNSAQVSGNGAIAIGSTSGTTVSGQGSISLGAFTPQNTTAGVIEVGSTQTAYGYSSSNYRLLTGLYDPQSAHDAATKGYVDTVAASVEPDTVNATDWSGLWQ